jgi:aryl-alcohol dehydrogenase-like predicted oxidoreductase
VFSNQVQFSLIDRRPERNLLGWAQEHDRLIIAYSPLAQGLLSGRYSSSDRPGGMRAMRQNFLPENLDRAQELLDALREIAINHGAKPAQVALAWLIRKPNVVVIPGASSVAQLESNAAAADIDLTEEEDQRLSESSNQFRPVKGLAAATGLVRARLPL